MEKRLPEGEYTAIVVGTKTIDLDSGSKILILQMVVARGLHRGKRCEKKLFFGFDEEQAAKARFIRMGTVLRSLGTMQEDAQELAGALISVRLYYDEVGRQKVLICRHHGRDDIKKYR